jgi:hypothetical protein
MHYQLLPWSHPTLFLGLALMVALLVTWVAFCDHVNRSFLRHLAVSFGNQNANRSHMKKTSAQDKPSVDRLSYGIVYTKDVQMTWLLCIEANYIVYYGIVFLCHGIWAENLRKKMWWIGARRFGPMGHILIESDNNSWIVFLRKLPSKNRPYHTRSLKVTFFCLKYDILYRGGKGISVWYKFDYIFSEERPHFVVIATYHKIMTCYH